ncbi:MAG: hypothetical protein KDA88_03885 [Planctomycetaceae bacterium]|nr:hypothetical protein [Planctomycetaceae bacterium]MCB9950865.1 hypothetical protein [Planctomycetaceae bacterium]
MQTTHSNKAIDSRRGIIVVAAAILLVIVLVFAAMAIDVGYITATKAQMQNAADAGALVAAKEIGKTLTLEGPTTSEMATNEQNARMKAAEIVALNPNANHQSTVINAATDIEFGAAHWNASTNSWNMTWGTPPYNIARVTLRRSQANNTALPLFFAPILGRESTDLTVTATAAVLPTAGYRVKVGSNGKVPILPFAVDIDRWSLCLEGTGLDQYRYSKATKTVSAIGDGVTEINIFPIRDGSLPAGNSGTVNLGDPNNSTADISRQIVEGLNATDLSFFGGEISTADGPINVTGDPGISASFEDDLRSIIGQTRAIPIYEYVDGQGANTQYRIVKFVGCRIMAVKLTGPLTEKHLIVQPITASISTGVRTREWVYTPDSVLAPPVLID